MTARPRLEVRMLVRALKLQLAGEQTLVGALNALLTQKWSASVVNGQTILSTAEAGGSVPLAVIEQVDRATSVNPHTNSKRTLRETADGLITAYRSPLRQLMSFVEEMGAA